MCPKRDIGWSAASLVFMRTSTSSLQHVSSKDVSHRSGISVCILNNFNVCGFNRGAHEGAKHNATRDDEKLFHSRRSKAHRSASPRRTHGAHDDAHIIATEARSYPEAKQSTVGIHASRARLVLVLWRMSVSVGSATFFHSISSSQCWY